MLARNVEPAADKDGEMMDPLDAAGFESLVEQHHAAVRTFVRMLGVQPGWVDDVAQEVFLIAHRRFRDFDPSQGPFISWIRGIARRVVANEIRGAQRRMRVMRSADLASLLAPAAMDGPNDRMISTEIHTALAGCLDQLPEHGRDLIRMRYQDDLDAETMGQQTGREANAVRQSLFRLREVLRRCLDGKLDGMAWQ